MFQKMLLLLLVVLLLWNFGQRENFFSVGPNTPESPAPAYTSFGYYSDLNETRWNCDCMQHGEYHTMRYGNPDCPCTNRCIKANHCYQTPTNCGRQLPDMCY